MKIKPLGDKIIVRPVGPVGKVGRIIMPHNYQQGLRTHHMAVVLAVGPKAAEQGCEVGTMVHVSETWGEKFSYDGKELYSGRLRDINGMVEGVALEVPAEELARN